MKLATWNVNSIRARLERVVDWTLKQAPDVLCLQELKCLDEQFPREVFEDLGLPRGHPRAEDLQRRGDPLAA
jgi:exodeoxyribonuclease-3